MTTESESAKPEAARSLPSFSIFRNWVSLCGLVVAVGSFFAFILLFGLDVFAHFSNPYMGVLIYLVAPGFLALGLGLVVLGWLISHRFFLRSKRAMPSLSLWIDFSRPGHRRFLGVFAAGTVVFLLVTAVGSYNSYHFTESVQFCGRTCHAVMNPELTTYANSPHARVACTECHIGPGATWFVRSKLSGTYQVYAVLADKYPRPIPTPIKNLRPAQVTCEQCHWPKAFVGNVDRLFSHFLTDSNNTPYSVRLLLKVGGADPTHGPVEGIHWHMNVANKIEYVAADRERQVIPWVRITDQQGVVTEYVAPGFTNAPASDAVRTMDCMDCHNRPAHKYGKPDSAIDLAMALRQIDPTTPNIKKNAVSALVQSYASESEAREKIATTLANQYPGDPRIAKIIDAVQRIYRDNFFPAMKANWKSYPDNIGHKDWPGCFRCHDGQHTSRDGKKTVKANDCNACHIILAQGRGTELDKLNAEGQPFAHPGGDIGELKCTDCHNGGLMQ